MNGFRVDDKRDCLTLDCDAHGSRFDLPQPQPQAVSEDAAGKLANDTHDALARGMIELYDMPRLLAEKMRSLVADETSALRDENARLRDELAAITTQFRLCAAHGGTAGKRHAPKYCPKCHDEQVAGLEADLRNAHTVLAALLQRFDGQPENPAPQQQSSTQPQPADAAKVETAEEFGRWAFGSDNAVPSAIAARLRNREAAIRADERASATKAERERCVKHLDRFAAYGDWSRTHADIANGAPAGGGK